MVLLPLLSEKTEFRFLRGTDGIRFRTSLSLGAAALDIGGRMLSPLAIVPMAFQM